MRRSSRSTALFFPQMANWLPKQEGEQLCFQFEEELARLEAG
jgi:hypothetical protein